jgi:hypothetical protein
MIAVDRCLSATGKVAGAVRSAWTPGVGNSLQPWLAARTELPIGPLFCVTDGPTRGRRWSGSSVRFELHRLAAHAGVRRRFAPHQLRHAHALELAHEGVALNIIQRQLGHAQPRHHLHLRARHRHRRDHRHCPRAPRTDDVRDRRTPPLTKRREPHSALPPPPLPLNQAKHSSRTPQPGPHDTRARRPAQALIRSLGAASPGVARHPVSTDRHWLDAGCQTAAVAGEEGRLV